MNHDQIAMAGTSMHSWPSVNNRNSSMSASKTYANPSLWKQTTVSQHSMGGDEAFSIGPDGYVWSYVTSGAQYASGRLIATGLQASRFILATAAGHRKLLVGAADNKLRFVIETGGPSPRWHNPVRIDCAGLNGAVEVTDIQTLTSAGQVFIGVQARYEHFTGPDSYQFWMGRWKGDHFAFRSAPVEVDDYDPIARELLWRGAALIDA
jgi:hypothetical protein